MLFQVLISLTLSSTLCICLYWTLQTFLFFFIGLYADIFLYCLDCMSSQNWQIFQVHQVNIQDIVYGKGQVASYATWYLQFILQVFTKTHQVPQKSIPKSDHQHKFFFSAVHMPWSLPQFSPSLVFFQQFLFSLLS